MSAESKTTLSDLLASIACVFVYSLMVQWMWNSSISSIFSLKEISYEESISLFLLCHFLFLKKFNI